VLAERIQALVADRDRRRRMAATVRTFAKPQAAKMIVDRALALMTRER